MRKIILFILSLFYFGFFHGQLKLADILFNNFEYKTAAKIYSESSSLSKKQLENYALSYFYTNDFHKSNTVFKKVLEDEIIMLAPKPSTLEKFNFSLLVSIF